MESIHNIDRRTSWLHGSPKRVEHPPGSQRLDGSAVLSVELNEDEEVVWHWTHFSDGRSVVTGYSIVLANGIALGS